MTTIYSSFSVFINTLRSRRNRQHFANDIFKRIFFNDVWISINISLKFIPKGPIINIPALVQIMAWRRPGDKSLSEPMPVILLTQICVTRPQWVNTLKHDQITYILFSTFWNAYFTLAVYKGSTDNHINLTNGLTPTRWSMMTLFTDARTRHNASVRFASLKNYMKTQVSKLSTGK